MEVSRFYLLLPFFNVRLAMAREGTELPRSLSGSKLESISASFISDAWKDEINGLRPDLDDATNALNKVLDEVEEPSINRKVKQE